MNLITSIKHFFIIPYLKLVKDKEQKLFIGQNSQFEMIKEMKKRKIDNVLVVTDKTIMSLNLAGFLLKTLSANNINYVIYDEVECDPSIETVEKGFDKYKENNCASILAIGGGSVIDCAKVIGARVSDPNRSIYKMKRLIGGIRKQTPPFMAIPTTSGTGSENTLYALITNKETKQKYPMFSNKYIPQIVALDPYLTVNLPLNITAYTGMDALTHAIEAYVSTYSKFFKKDKNEGLEAIKLIFDNLEKVYKEPTNIKYRENMAIASYKAGLSFRKISIGYVHAIAHRMGEFYHLPHGLAIAVILPYVLEYMLDKAYNSLSEIALYCKLGNENEDKKELALKFINKVKELNKTLKIPEHIKEIKESDYPILIKRILREGSLCGNPRLMSKKDCKEMLDRIKGVSNEK